MSQVRSSSARQAAMRAKKEVKLEDGDAKYKKFMADLAKALKEPNTIKVRCGGGGGGYGWKVVKVVEEKIEYTDEWEDDWESEEEGDGAASNK